MQVCLNGEPIFAQQPAEGPSLSAGAGKAALQSSSLFAREDK
jgi:hypothetical protein